jgi:hypothetical protein
MGRPIGSPNREKSFNEPLDLRTALLTVHKDSSQHQASTDKAAFSGGIRGASRQNNSIAI